MKVLKKYLLLMLMLALFQAMTACDSTESSKAYAMESPVPTIITSVVVQGNIDIDFYFNKESEPLVKAGFSIGGGYGAKTNEKGEFGLAAPYSPSVIDITIEKPGYLKRTLKQIDIHRQSTNLLNIPMWAGDMNGDNTINMEDIIGTAMLFNSTQEETQYQPHADFDKNNVINIIDIMIVSKHFNATSESYPPYIQIFPTPSPTSTPLPNTGVEIERKFLLDITKIPYNFGMWDKYDLVQAYISFSPEIRVRSANARMFFLTVKAPIDAEGMVREEREFSITQEEFEKLFAKKEGSVIYKTRYQSTIDDNIYAIDVYKENLQGLAVLEIEFASVEKANSFIPPDWVGPDVTSDKRYKNASLAKNGLPATN